jgi:uncharacterized protein YjbJ (UPF0337 family)
MAGEWDKLEGKVKEFQGDVAGDEKTEAEGKLQEKRGEGKDKLDKAKDVAGERIEEGRDELRERL